MEDSKSCGLLIFNLKIARQFIRAGYKVVDIKPHNKRKHQSVFVFERTAETESLLKRLMNQ